MQISSEHLRYLTYVRFNTKEGRSNKRGPLLLHYVLEGKTDLEVERQSVKVSFIVSVYSLIY